MPFVRNAFILTLLYGAHQWTQFAQAQPMGGLPVNPADAPHWLALTLEYAFTVLLPKALVFGLAFGLTLFFAWVIPLFLGTIVGQFQARRNWQMLTIYVSAIVIFIYGIYLALGVIGVDLTAIVFGFGVAGLWLSDGSRATTANAIAGVQLQTDNSVEVGNTLVVPSYGINGVIVHMDLRQIIVLPPQSDVPAGFVRFSYVPNQILVNSPHDIIKRDDAATKKFRQNHFKPTANKKNDNEMTLMDNVNAGVPLDLNFG